MDTEMCHPNAPSGRGLFPQMQGELLAESLQLSVPPVMVVVTKPPCPRSHPSHSNLHPVTDVVEGRL